MSNDNVHFSSESNKCETPQDFYNKLNKEFNFTLDPCASPETAKCDKFYTKKDNGLSKDWSRDTVFMNPPYGREIKYWIEKAYKESVKGATVVCLIPARTDTRYWHSYIFKYASEIRFIKGRLKFGDSNNSAPFPSAVIVFNDSKDNQKITTMDR